jgi:hypothetical protein
MNAAQSAGTGIKDANTYLSANVPAWTKKAMPWLGTGLSTVGALETGFTRAAALRANARTYATEGEVAARQGLEQENQQRRMGARMQGEAIGSAAQSGTGYGGSTGALIRQNAMATELDALNIRYKAQLQNWAYGAQAQNIRSEARSTQADTYLRSGAALLRGWSGNYTGSPGFVAQW